VRGRAAGRIAGMRMRFMAGVALVLASCAAPGSRMWVEVDLPPFPVAWVGAGGWELSWTDGVEGGTVRAGPGERVALALPRDGFATVTCAALFGDRKTLPLGALWPSGRRADGGLSPDAPGGYAAALALVLLRAGFDPAGFDLERFGSEAAARMADPWDLPPASLAPAVVQGRFRADHLRAPRTTPAVVAGLDGPLAPDSPWGAILAPGPDGTAAVDLGAAPRSWFGSGRTLTASIDATGRPAWTLAP